MRTGEVSATMDTEAVGLVDLDVADLHRLHRATRTAYLSLYRAAGPIVGSGAVRLGSALAMWNPADESAGYSNLSGLEEVEPTDREAVWAEALVAARGGGARRFGLVVPPELAPWATADRLAALGLDEEYEEAVWARRLPDRGVRPTEAAPIPSASDPAVTVATVGFGPETFARTLNRGWELPEDHARGHLYAAALGASGWTHYLMRVAGIPAAAGALCLSDGVALCMVATTDRTFRGRGLQAMLIARRLKDGAASGADLAAAETVEENASPRNFRRAGFGLVHRRRIYRIALLPDAAP